MRVHFATDHAGFELKEELVNFVANDLGYEVVDHGAKELDPTDDYPDYVAEAAAAVAAAGKDGRGIVIGKSGQGEAMAANRFPGVRAMVYYSAPLEVAILSREHNDSNVLSLGAGFISTEEAKTVVQRWLATDFSGDERHVRRNQKLDKLN